ncbi:MAG: RNA polymerase sigma factor [Proteobacteria bacterium]|nr:RNA polymerase sigma factor [Pseudomonadota bacterium]MCP4919456.1 RNA polymerase sigma factor [Pseudomonadota bacterium]
MTHHRDSDLDIKELALANREAAMGRAVQRYRGALERRAVSIVKDSQEARDAVQEVFIKAMRERRFFDREFQIRAWLFRVTTNLCFNIVRDRRRRGGILADMPDECVPQGSTRPTREQVLRGQLREGLLGALNELTPNHREILLLRYYQDLSYAEIAETLDIRLGTVMSRLSRARGRLAESLGRDHPLVAAAM